MAILKSGPLGPFRKKAGSVIGRKRRGQNIMTGLHNDITTAPSKKQREERKKFGMLNSFLSQIEPLVSKGFKKYSKNKYALNVAYSYNAAHAFVHEDGEWKLNYPSLVHSRGHVSRPEGVALEVISDGMAFSWQPQPQSAYCQYTDLASFLIYNPNKRIPIVATEVTNRYALQYVQKGIPWNFVNDTLHCYMSFASADGKQTGNSVYLGAVVFNQ